MLRFLDFHQGFLSLSHTWSNTNPIATYALPVFRSLALVLSVVDFDAVL